jgi:hypothetical protein
VRRLRDKLRVGNKASAQSSIDDKRHPTRIAVLGNGDLSLAATSADEAGRLTDDARVQLSAFAEYKHSKAQ